MLDTLGPLGITGFLFVLAGLAVVAFANPLVAAGLALVLAGLALLVRRGYQAGMEMLGMA